MAGNRDVATRGRFKKRRHDIIKLMLGILLPMAIVEFVSTIFPSNLTRTEVLPSVPSGRRLLEEEAELNCTPRSIHQFPDDFMTKEQRRKGGVVFHVFLVLYTFAATAMACDDFFVPSLEKMVEVSHIQPDVAGATFMAAGSSAPEFFAAVIGISFAQSDIGLSTIVGSAVFNLLLVNATCGLFAGMVVYLTWWPVIRDCSFYAISLVVLIVVMYDDQVHWYESLVMVSLYVLYVLLMYYNKRVGQYLMDNVTVFLDNRKHIDNHEFKFGGGLKRASTSGSGRDPEDNTSVAANRTSRNYGIYGSLEESHQSKRGNLAHSTRFEQGYVSPLKPPAANFKRFVWIILFPCSVLMVFTIPDFRRGGRWTRLYPLTFLTSIIWIAGLCYVMVWMVTITGDTIGVPDTIMGLTFLAIGSSVPDIFASLLVAQDGYGDMAVSNAIGSNIFDILICLGVPWLIQTTIVKPNSIVLIASRGLSYSTITLLGTIVFLVGSFVFSGWRLTKPLGFACLLAYLVVIGISCLFQLNLFGPTSLPACPW